MWPVPILGSGRDGGGYGATVTGVGQPESTQQIAVGDVWDALEGASFQITKQATGRRLLTGPASQDMLWLMKCRTFLCPRTSPAAGS